MILDFSVDTTSNREVTEAIDLLLYMKHGHHAGTVATMPVAKETGTVTSIPNTVIAKLEPKPAKTKKAAPVVDERQTAMPGTAPEKIDAKMVQDLTRKLMNSGKDGVAEATRCLGAVSATSLSKVPVERMAEYVALVQKALDTRASAQ